MRYFNKIISSLNTVYKAYLSRNSLIIPLLFLLVMAATSVMLRYFYISPFEYSEARFAPPGAEGHLLGTDSYGRDILARVFYAFCVSMPIGVLSVLFSCIVGFTTGIISGFKGKVYDIIIQRLVDAFLAFPGLLIGLMVVVALGSGYWSIILAIGIAYSARFARLARGATLNICDEPFIEAARGYGASTFRIIYRHLVPNLSGILVTYSTLYISSAILLESGLSFLGLGVQPPTPSWGSMIRAGFQVKSSAPWVPLFPALFLLLCVLAVTFMGDGLRDQLDPKSKKSAGSTE